MSLTPTVHDDIVESALGYLRDGTSVSLRGLPGSGRSTLLGRVTTQLNAAGWKTLELRGNPALRDRPLEALAIAGLVPANPTHTRSAVAAATDALLRSIEPRRTVVVVDDADDLDAASIGAISSAINQVHTPLLSSASTARRAPDLSLAALVRPGVRLSLPPLAYDESAQLVETICHGPVDRATIALIHGRAAGLPALVQAIADNARRAGVLRQVGGMWTAGPDLWTPHLARTVESFLQGLSLEAREALTQLSLVGPVEVSVAQRLTGWPALEELDERGLLAFDSAPGSVSVMVSPPLVADHLNREHVGARRLRVVGEIGAALGAASGGSSWPLPTTAPAPTVADFDPVAGDPRHADAELNRMVAERHAAQVLVRRAEWEQRPDARTTLAYARALSYRGADLAQLDELLAAQAPGASRDRALLAAWRGLSIAFGKDDPEGALAHLASEESEPWHGVRAAAARHVRLFCDRVPDDAEPQDRDSSAVEPLRLVRGEELLARGRGREALAQFDAVGDPALAASARIGRGLALLLAGDIDAAEAHATRGYQEGRSSRDPELLVPHGYVLALVHHLRGDERALRENLGSLLSVDAVALIHTPYRLGALVLAARVAARAGRSRAARSLWEHAQALGRHAGPFPAMATAQAGAHARLAEGEAAESVADELWAQFEELRERRYVAAAVVAGMWAVEVHPDAARASEVVRASQETDSRLLTLIGRYAEALSSTDGAAVARAGEDLLKAGLRGPGLVLLAAASRRLAASDPDRAADVLRQARRLATKLGGDFPRVVDPVPPRSALTAREREVAELAAQGMSNQEVASTLMLSVRTVENHLHRAFQKLDVASRAALGEALRGAQ
ncbi:LuxR C-terminal-related transcriptional regulator [Microbacterium sp. Marseille-Q6965]|uniref:helix-turn-helix transcriptional regulator n=1 Tax=Microbacterium sp. Marseille-Q6965 TaxID=2965072 RepID=UPI0021B6F384|nr:LuxR C-terminal-related transcriptional regulator [Microbacterium sp. Marseille-Q6965]